MYRFVIKKRYLDMLLVLEFGGATIKEISKTSGMNYTHLTHVMTQWGKDRVVKKTLKDKCEYEITLTKKGKKIVQCLKGIKKIIDEKVSEDLENGLEDDGETEDEERAREVAEGEKTGENTNDETEEDKNDTTTAE